MEASQARRALRPLLRRLYGGGGGAGSFSWMFAAALGFVTLNSAMAVYRSKADADIITFVVTSYMQLVMLSFSLFLHERAPPGSPWRERLKASIWVITTLLTFSFAYMAMGTGSATLTLPLTLLCWVMAAATGVTAFVAFFQEARVNQPPDEAVMPLV